MKNLRLSLAVIAVVAGSAFAVSTSANAKNFFAFSTEGVYQANSTPAVVGNRLGNDADLNTLAATHCTTGTPNCVAIFTSATTVSGTIKTGIFN